MKERPGMNPAPYVTNTFLKYLGISAQSVAGSQIMHREAITAGVVDAELR